MLLAAVTALIASFLLTRAAQEGRLATRSFYQNVALNLAEAGLEEAMWAANNGYFTTAYGWSAPADSTTSRVKTTTGLALAQGTGEIHLRVDNATSTAPTVFALGLVRMPDQPIILKQVRVTLERRALWANGMVARGVITFSGNAAVDSYDSSLGPYNSTTNRSDLATVASTSTSLDPVVLNSNATIYGFVATAGADPDVSSNGRIYGATTPSHIKVDPARIRRDFAANLPDATVPAGTPVALGGVGSSLTLPRPGDTPGANGRYLYTATSVGLSSSSTLAIKGPVDLIVTGSVTLTGNSSIGIGGIGSTDPSLGLYAAGDVNLAGNGLLNETSQPISATIYGTAPAGTPQSISITGNGDFIGTVYAPNATLKLNGNGANSGAVIAKDVTLGGNGKFHYDIRLGLATSEKYFKPKSWIELTAPAGSGQPLARDNRAPFTSFL